MNRTYELHIDYSAVDNDKCYTLHAAGCKHRSKGRVKVLPVTGLDDPTCLEAKSLDWNIHIAPCARSAK